MVKKEIVKDFRHEVFTATCNKCSGVAKYDISLVCQACGSYSCCSNCDVCSGCNLSCCTTCMETEDKCKSCFLKSKYTKSKFSFS